MIPKILSLILSTAPTIASDASVEANWTDEVNSFYESDTDDRAARDDQYKKFYDQIGLKNGGGFFGDQ